MTHEEWKQNRRAFLKFATTSTAYTTAAVTIAFKTDAASAKPIFQAFKTTANGQDGMPYPYMNP